MPHRPSTHLQRLANPNCAVVQGQLFFGSMLQLTSSLEAAASDHRIDAGLQGSFGGDFSFVKCRGCPSRPPPPPFLYPVAGYRVPPLANGVVSRSSLGDYVEETAVFYSRNPIHNKQRLQIRIKMAESFHRFIAESIDETEVSRFKYWGIRTPMRQDTGNRESPIKIWSKGRPVPIKKCTGERSSLTKM